MRDLNQNYISTDDFIVFIKSDASDVQYVVLFAGTEDECNYFIENYAGASKVSISGDGQRFYEYSDGDDSNAALGCCYATSYVSAPDFEKSRRLESVFFLDTMSVKDVLSDHLEFLDYRKS